MSIGPNTTGAGETAQRDADILGKPPRIAPLSPAEYTDEVRALAAEMRVAAALPPDDYIPEYVATVLRHPTLFRRHSDLAVALMAQGSLTVRDRELAILRTGWLCQAPFEWAAHVAMAKRVSDITSEEIERVTVGAGAPGWSRHDRALISAVEELHANAMISDATWARLTEDLDEKQLMELPILVAQYIGVAFLQNSLRMRMMPGQLGLSDR